VAGPVTNSAVAVTNGLFTVTIDFGGGPWNGQTNWLQIAVETNAAGATFTTLTPRQQLTPVPYAIYAESAGSAASAGSVSAANIVGTIPVTQLPASVITNGASGVEVTGTFNGNGAGLTSVSAAQLTSIGNTNFASYGNFFVGPSGNSTTSGYYNTANGEQALAANTSGSQNTAIGATALLDNTSGFGNTANGYAALFNNTSGSNNIALGNAAGYDITTGSYNIDIGNPGQGSDTNIIRIGNGQSQTFIAGVITGNGTGLNGVSAGQLASIGNTNGGSGNFFVASGNSTTSGSDNTAIGGTALFSNANGSYNTANGFDALSDNTNGSYNTANGCYALYLNSRGSNNIALGYQAGYDITTGSYNIDIGNTGQGSDTNIIRIGSGQTATYLSGVAYATSFSPTSDRNAKENFTAVNAREVLAKVASLPVTEWNYKTDSKDVQHIGPMAQDFQAAFGLNGPDDKHISVVDEGGVALAAIQGLNQKLEETQQAVKAKDGQIQTLKQQNDSLAERLNELEATVKQLAAQK
jgi:hypothetical protein